jgi:hypothetical protein
MPHAVSPYDKAGGADSRHLGEGNAPRRRVRAMQYPLGHP